MNRRSHFCCQNREEGVGVSGAVWQVKAERVVLILRIAIPGTELAKHRSIRHVMAVNDRVFIREVLAVYGIQKNC